MQVEHLEIDPVLRSDARLYLDGVLILHGEDIIEAWSDVSNCYERLFGHWLELEGQDLNDCTGLLRIVWLARSELMWRKTAERCWQLLDRYAPAIRVEGRELILRLESDVSRHGDFAWARLELLEWLDSALKERRDDSMG